jgi:hypothetical protein
MARSDSLQVLMHSSSCLICVIRCTGFMYAYLNVTIGTKYAVIEITRDSVYRKRVNRYTLVFGNDFNQCVSHLPPALSYLKVNRYFNHTTRLPTPSLLFFVHSPGYTPTDSEESMGGDSSGQNTAISWITHT